MQAISPLVVGDLISIYDDKNALPFVGNVPFYDRSLTFSPIMRVSNVGVGEFTVVSTLTNMVDVVAMKPKVSTDGIEVGDFWSLVGHREIDAYPFLKSASGELFVNGADRNTSFCRRGVMHRFEVAPMDIGRVKLSDGRFCQFETAQQIFRQSKSRQITGQNPKIGHLAKWPEDVNGDPLYDELPNDNPIGNQHQDVSVWENNPGEDGFLFRQDSPGWPYQIAFDDFYAVYRANFYTYCRVDFVNENQLSNTTFGNVLKGSRCSPKIKWSVAVNVENDIDRKFQNPQGDTTNRYLHIQRFNNLSNALDMIGTTDKEPQNMLVVGKHIVHAEIEAVLNITE